MLVRKTCSMGPIAPVFIGRNIVKWVTRTKLLGMIVDDKITWVPHTSELIKTFAKKLNLLKLSRYLPRKVLKEFYFKVNAALSRILPRSILVEGRLKHFATIRYALPLMWYKEGQTDLILLEYLCPLFFLLRLISWAMNSAVLSGSIVLNASRTAGFSISLFLIIVGNFRTRLKYS